MRKLSYTTKCACRHCAVAGLPLPGLRRIAEPVWSSRCRPS